MYVYLALLRYFPYPVFFDDNSDEPLPPGFSRLISSGGNVTTGNGDRVIVKSP